MSDCCFGVSPVNYPDPDPDPLLLIQSNAQNAYLIYSVCRLLLKINSSNVLNTLVINKVVVNLATRALVTSSDGYPSK